jgi:uncharacterized protein (DUF2267 family)
MKHAQFIEKVAERANVSLGQAESLTQATLQTLAERISGGEARDLAAQLPKQLQPFLIKNEEDAERFGLDEFIRRVALRAGVERELADTGARAVMQTLHGAVSRGEFEDVMAQLPREFQELVPMAVRRT